MWGCGICFLVLLPGGRVVINASGELNSLGWLTVVRDSRVGGSCLPALSVSRVAVGSWNLL